MSILDSTRRSWYSPPMILAALLVAFVFGVNHSLRRRPTPTRTVPLGTYFCESCATTYLLPYDPKGVPCPVCTPLFQRLEETIEWTR